MSWGPRTGFAEMLNQETSDVRFCQVLVIGDVRFCQVLVTRKRPGIGDLAQFFPNPYAAECGTCAPRPDAPSIGYSSCRGKLVAQAPRCGPVALLWYRSGGANGPAIKLEPYDRACLAGRGRSRGDASRKLSKPDFSPATAPTAGAARMRRYRERRKRAGVLVEFEIVGTPLEDLVALGWLDAADQGSRDAVAVAVVALAVRALALRVRPNG